jgi:outer membrane receptor protein involved in Fe transport
MLRLASPIAAIAVLCAVPAKAQEVRHSVDVPESRLDQAVRTLGRQTGASIGFRERKLGNLRVSATEGDLTAGEALVLMLRGSGVRARRMGKSAFLIETDPDWKPQARETRAQALATRAASKKPAPIVDIIVTASKRDIPISAYPGMVHVMEGDRISAASGRKGTEALEALSASIVSTHLGPGRNKLFIRGIADSSFVGPTQATVGQYWGNSRITYSAPDPNLKLYDIGRVEVLEGPQGTLYGAGSLGGIVRVIPREPKLDRTEAVGWAGIEAVNHGEIGYDGGAVINLPIVEDRLAMRVVGFGAIENGYIDDLGRGLDDVNDVDSYGGRLSLRYVDDEGLTVDGSLVGQRIDGKDSQYSERQLGELVRSSTMAQPYRNGFLLTDLVVRKSWDEYELTASLGYADQYVFERFEGPALPDLENSLLAPAGDAPPAAYTQANDQSMLTAETRLARHGPDGTGWMIAASLLRNEARLDRSMDLFLAPNPLTGISNTVEEATVYGEATLAASDKLNLTFGGRLSHSKLSSKVVDPVLPEMIYLFDPAAGDSRKETEFLPSAALAYQLNDDLTLFARYQEGFRPGGIAVRREFVQRYEADQLQMVEGGARYRGAEFEVEASASWTEWSNIQADLIDGFGFPTTANVGDGRVLSVGVSGRWRPVPSLSLDGSVYFNSSRVTDQAQILRAVFPETDLSEFDRLPNIADAIGQIAFTWSTAIGADTDFELTGFGRYVGKSVLGVGSLLGRLQGDYFDTGLEVRLGRGRTHYSLAMTNLFDSKGNRFALGSPFQLHDFDQITPLKPRSIRLGVEIDF